METDHEQRPFATGSGAKPSGLRERIEAAAALQEAIVESAWVELEPEDAEREAQ